MSPQTCAMAVAAAYALISGRKLAGLYDHAAARHLRIAAEARGEHLQGYDGDRDARFGGTLPEIYDAGSKVFVSMEIDGATARGHDRGSSTDYSITVGERQAQLYDHGESQWFSFDVQVA
ncbi:hypothetical protein [Rhizorhabdus dicambivorans]|uniref:Uncharacterized protein n=1 Tax=Rhizorhabdus dicambivorans TaxID=1850238 RepID=A0A2A4FY28_9SPHN|nr:hypothetical protein [Rhizorhabdus dicambivorans]ATE65996.1 hypothetical protein CMV14_17600 [Rhizorhabdus dicambivorans]PCE43113.1 hypothetical protein COO09_07385 [Rhizorhabdus dicambivorans]